MSTQIKQSGRVSPNSYYKNKRISQNLEKKEKEKRETLEKSTEKPENQNGRQSPNKFVFALPSTSKQSTAQSSKQIPSVSTNQPPRYKSKNMKPLLTLQELENTQNINTSSTMPINIPNSRNRNTSNYNSIENSLDNSPINSPPHIIDLLIDNIIAEGRDVEQDVEPDVEKEVKKTKLNTSDTNTDTDTDTDTNTISNLQKTNLFNNYQYYFHLKIINILKHLVFQNKGLICGSFNAQQLTINEYTKSFMNQLKFYHTIIINNSENNSDSNSSLNITDEQINDLFMNELVLPDTKKRLKLQSSMEILISYPNFINFINNMKHYFDNETSTNYKLEYINRGNMKDNVDKTSDLYLYNTDWNQIYLNIVKIFDQT